MNQAFTIEDLSAIWRRLFKRSSIGTNDNFFELGGNPELAVQMFQQIGDLCGRELPSVMIYQAPTIGTLAALIQGSSQTISCPPLLPIKRGTSPAIFLAHGMGGDAMQLLHVAERLKVTNSIYSTQAPGIDGVNDPLDSVEKMATVFLAAMRAVQPYGPYILIGYSFGGLVMMEIAHRLQAQGEAIAFLAMLDTYPHRIYLRP